MAKPHTTTRSPRTVAAQRSASAPLRTTAESLHPRGMNRKRVKRLLSALKRAHKPPRSKR